MDHHCHRCGAAVADSAPFCSQCGAPQIRVNVNAPDESTPAIAPRVAATASRVHWRIALPRVLGAAVLGTILQMFFSAVPKLLPPLLMILLIIPFAGAISVWLYKAKDPLIDSGKGFRLGAVTGFFIFAFNLLPVIFAYLFARGEFVNAIKQQVDTATQNADPRAQEMMNKLVQHPETMAAIIALMAVLMLIVFSIGAGVGGAIAGRSARRS